MQETLWKPHKTTIVKPTSVIPKKAVQTGKPAKQPILKPSKRLTGKQQAFIKHIVDNPKAPIKQAAMAAYDKQGHMAEVIASENMRKPEILAELAKYSNEAEITVIEVMKQSKKKMYDDRITRAVDWGNLANTTANSLLDRLHGKATIKTENLNKTVTLNVDLTGVAVASEGADDVSSTIPQTLSDLKE